MAYIPKPGPVLGATAYVDGEAIANEVSATLPAVEFVTAEVVVGGGTIEAVQPRVGVLTATITKQGIDSAFRKMLGLKPRTFELRWVGDEIDAEGVRTKAAFKAFLTGVAKSIPGFGTTVGETGDNEITLTLSRYSLVRDGEEVLSIDVISGKCALNGTDFAEDIASYL